MRFIPSKNNQQLGRCCCGKEFLGHQHGAPVTANDDANLLMVNKDERWSVQRHTRLETTDAFGLIEFEGMAHPTKARVRQNEHAFSCCFESHVCTPGTRSIPLSLPVSVPSACSRYASGVDLEIIPACLESEITSARHLHRRWYR